MKVKVSVRDKYPETDVSSASDQEDTAFFLANDRDLVLVDLLAFDASSRVAASQALCLDGREGRVLDIRKGGLSCERAAIRAQGQRYFLDVRIELFRRDQFPEVCEIKQPPELEQWCFAGVVQIQGRNDRLLSHEGTANERRTW